MKAEYDRLQYEELQNLVTNMNNANMNELSSLQSANEQSLLRIAEVEREKDMFKTRYESMVDLFIGLGMPVPYD